MNDPVIVPLPVSYQWFESFAAHAREAGLKPHELILHFAQETAKSKAAIRRAIKAATDSEVFTAGGIKFDVSRARLIVKGRAPNYVLDLNAEVIRKHIEKTSVNLSYTMIADLSDPAIVVRHSRKGMIAIDGNHRIAKAILFKRESLPAHLLTEAEAKSIRIR